MIGRGITLGVLAATAALWVMLPGWLESTPLENLGFVAPVLAVFFFLGLVDDIVVAVDKRRAKAHPEVG